MGAMTDTAPTRLIAVVLTVVAIGGIAISGVAVADEHTTGNGDEGVDTQQSSYLRVIHATAGAPAVDVAVDGETVLSNVEYGAVSDYLRLPAGNHSVTISASESGEVVYEGSVFLDARTATTLAAAPAPSQTGGVTDGEPVETPTPTEMAGENETEMVGENETEMVGENETEMAGGNETAMLGENETEMAGGNETEMVGENETEMVGENETNGEASSLEIQPVIYEDNAWDPGNDSAALSGVHLVPGAPSVDVTIPTAGQTDGEPMAGNETMGNETEMVGENETEMVGENETEMVGDNETEMVGENETEMVGDNETEMVGNETTETEMAGDGAGEEFIVLAENLSFGSASDYVTVPAGEHTVQIRAAAPDNQGEVLLTVNVTVEGGTAHSAVALAPSQADAGNETMGNETEMAGGNETAMVGENETEMVGENETEMAGNETEVVGNETEMAGETPTNGGGAAAPLMAILTDDVTYSIHLPGDAEMGTDDANATTPTDAGMNATETPGFVENATETPGANATEAPGAGTNETATEEAGA